MTAAPVEVEAPVIVCDVCGARKYVQFQERMHPTLADKWQIERHTPGCNEWMWSFENGFRSRPCEFSL